MTASYNQTISHQAQSQKTQNLVERFNALDTDAKLAWLYFVYEKMGETITPAAPSAAEPELAPMLVGDYLQLSDEEQLEIMRDIINCTDTVYSRAYGALKENNQLFVWYVWAEAMGDTVVGMPDNYESDETIHDLLAQIEEIEFEAQISVLRTIAGQMGYSDVKPIATQAETGKTASL
ncbi:orange carotenoid protein [Anabaena cylindrica FACHB-243]|uniref:Orange carotenoid-binding protein n=1 Tax=Anabaena cylindrica (strain ATCC 27899 / PCC 7122) TaxID=272123 RepID=K9ZG52_ANACC|nr:MULTISPECIES: orange carotenoid protein N-terminal domain-containing protein [Anabaena]AFZ58176.1 Orange carotenoid-binding protein [Anabaena cylindrica PCC 7122]MBD2419048.1 orange carotenoid protein [Anabaena cylindrica FACHB-243]MBY5281196.1 orange carotenoid protein [Anabaena sp. CCAP 1446/1C]MBY5310265.1 orange carotenoid protein [Anabaena sp. CCAP 1446/1C]MCM2409517.1 orange carotenoid protein [Anabaena sp. CCAP 1446/1C]